MGTRINEYGEIIRGNTSKRTRINEYGEIVRDEPPRLSISARVLNFDSNGESRVVYISINQGNWYAKVESGVWIDLTRTSYGISIRLPRNASGSPRHGSILVYSDYDSVWHRIEVHQETAYYQPASSSSGSSSSDSSGCGTILWCILIGIEMMFAIFFIIDVLQRLFS